ncbi:sulfatase [Halomarina halobia]|uniref:Sulfatase n=1 Tax=Halomarina halobia TaxID=3033386 RepID=A0ABD6AD48_9EURY|nr:sulfatase-like hydrolase/transferase [Halomarina sp. PSR21]
MRVVYIDIDSLRADHVGTYGYDAPTTPNLDEFAADAVAFDNAYVANSPCLPSRAALLSGRYGMRNGVETHGPRSQRLDHPVNDVDWAGTWSDHVPSRPWWSLPRLFYEERVPTLAVSSFPRHPAPWFHDTWHEVHQPQEPSGGYESFQTPRAESVVDRAIDVLTRYEDRNFFAYIQLWDPHGPYLRSHEEVEAFADVPMPEYPTADAIADHQCWNAWRSADHMDVNDRNDLRELIANYDAEIRYTDRHAGRLLAYLKSNNVYDNSLIVVTADHGEEFGEHGLYREHWSTHDGTQRVPLLVKPPADTDYEPGHRPQLVTNVDMAPTLAAYAGLDAPPRWQGDSLRAVLESADEPWRDAVVFDHGLYTAQRAIRTDRWKLIKTYHAGMWEGPIPDVQLYDMEADPWEQSDLSELELEVVDRLECKMAVWVEEHLGSDEDALRTVATHGPAGYRAFRDEFEGVTSTDGN